MQERTPRLGLPWLMPAQAQKHVTVNEALARLDMLVQASVLSRTLSGQPETPSEGEGYLLPDAPQGADWSSQSEGVLMVFHEGVWTAVQPWAGLTVYVADEAVSLIHDGAEWTALKDQVRALGGLEALGVGTQADPVNRVAIKSTGVLMSADDAGPGDMRLTMNKSDASRTASLVFQSNWSGRAELGLTGDEAFSIKVSDDGASWLEALKVSAGDGVVTLSGLSVLSGRLSLSASHTPASAAAPGQAGDLCWDGDFVYVCVAANQWRRSALSAW
ncbi:DUF2793 domain-containing protein [Oceanicaulis alexandrii]|uniref:DUF2793 domain-containing protein n=1 Tax=Oceanicaulis alexandrii TaxID=153233 RepID=UPI0003B38470|nr:DUF2793 domain-containing protein [Oceanicaulis alexandrii]